MYDLIDYFLDGVVASSARYKYVSGLNRSPH